MKPAPFEYHAPASLEEALELLGRYGEEAKVLAGGQSLLPLLNFRLARPAVIVDINRVPGLDAIDAGPGHVAIGALARQHRVERWAATRFHLLGATLRHVGHWAIRTRGTVAGSLAHADPAAELPALLRCLDGTVVARSRAGQREIPASDFFVAPLTTSLRADELVTSVRLPTPPGRAGWAVLEISRRHGDFALVGAMAVITLHGRRVAGARVAVFGCGPVPIRAVAAEQALAGQEPTPAQIAEAAAAGSGAEALAPDADLHASADYRRRVAVTLMRRALQTAVDRASARPA